MNKTIQYIAFGLIILLVLTNVGMLAGMWLKPALDRPPGPRPHLGEFLRKELNLRKSQMEAFRVVGDTHQKEMLHIHQEIAILKELMYNLMKEGRTMEEVGYLADKIGELHSQREQQTYQHFYELRELCDEEQKKKFDKLIKEVIRMMAPPPPRQRQDRGE